MKEGELQEAGKTLFWLTTWPSSVTLRIIVAFLYVVLFPVQIVCWLHSKHGFWTTFPYMFLYTLIDKDEHDKRKAKTISHTYVEFMWLVKYLDSWNYLNWVSFVKIYLMGKNFKKNDYGTIKVLKHSAKKHKLLRLSIGLVYLLLGLLPPLFLWILVVNVKAAS